MRSLFFIGRHGETGLNESGCYRGWSNGPDAQLNEDGVESAHQMAKFIVKLGQKFSKIICSPMERAQLTAAIIAEYLGVKNLELDDRLLPLNVGNLAGKPKEQNPINAYLENKNKRFPGGETINEFEQRQHEFAEYLLEQIEDQKSKDDVEVLVIAHVSNVMYWWNLQTGANSDEYLGESSDIVLPGGLALVAEHTTIPIFRENPEIEPVDFIQKDIRGEDKTGYETGKNGPFRCDNCEYFRYINKSCGQKDMMERSKLPRVDGRVKVDPAGCCEYVTRLKQEEHQ